MAEYRQCDTEKCSSQFFVFHHNWPSFTNHCRDEPKYQTRVWQPFMSESTMRDCTSHPVAPSLSKAGHWVHRRLQFDSQLKKPSQRKMYMAPNQKVLATLTKGTSMAQNEPKLLGFIWHCTTHQWAFAADGHTDRLTTWLRSDDDTTPLKPWS